MQTTHKTTATVKFAAFSIHYSTVVTTQKVRRPSKEDERREAWDRTAKMIWRIIIILSGLLTVVFLHQIHVEETATIFVVTERTPEIIGEVVEYLKKL